MIKSAMVWKGAKGSRRTATLCDGKLRGRLRERRWWIGSGRMGGWATDNPKLRGWWVVWFWLGVEALGRGRGLMMG